MEDIARFTLNHSPLTERLKALRHALLDMPPEVKARLLWARQVKEDVGATSPPQEGARASPVALVTANASRVEQALRVLEEVASSPGFPLPSAPFKEARFALYEIEGELVSLLGRKEKKGRVRGLYVILDPQATRGRDPLKVAEAALAGGARLIQLRDKVREKGEVLPLATELKRLCDDKGALFIVNDHLDLALAVGADGLHLGQKDLPVSLARRYLPPDSLLGCSAANLGEALQAERDGADYIAVGSIFPTSSKADFRLAGLETLRQVKERVFLPVVAIGGINRENIRGVIEAGADAVAVISAVLGAEDVAAAARELSKACSKGG